MTGPVTNAVAAAASTAFFVEGATTFEIIGIALFAAALSFAQSALAPSPKPRVPRVSSFADTAFARTFSFRQPITAWRILYGKIRTGGPVTFIEATDSNKFAHVVVTLAAHEVEKINPVQLNDDFIYAAQLDNTGLVTSGKYANKVRIKKHLGSATQSADTDLTQDTSVDANFRGRGRAYVYARFEFDRDVFPRSLPDVTAWIKGKKLLDTRTGSTVWSPNPALVIEDFMLTSPTNGGPGGATTEVSTSFFEAAANVCDEFVTTTDIALEVASTDTSSGVLFFVGSEGNALEFQDGDRVQITTTQSVPGGLALSTDYYVIADYPRHNDVFNKGVRLATTYANALSETYITLTSVGGGTHTVTKKAEPRYTASGVVEVDRAPGEIVKDMLSSLGGRMVYTNGTWKLNAAAYTAPTITLNESDLRGPLTVQTKHSRRERFNAVKGVYVSPLNDWQPADYPFITNSSYQSQDNGERRYSEIDFSWTTRPHTAMRLAKIELERQRQEITVSAKCKLSALQVEAGDTVNFDNTRYGWSGKAFEVIEWQFAPEENQDGSIYLGVDLSLRETASGIFDWAAGEETSIDLAPNTTLPSPNNVGAPTSLALASGTSQLDLRIDGTVFSRIQATWVVPSDQFVVANGFIEVQFKKSSVTSWQNANSVLGNDTTAWILDVKDNDYYDVRVRSKNHFGVPSSYTTVQSHLVLGKSVSPSDVTGFTAQQNGNVVTFRWNQVTDADLSGYELRYETQTTSAVWDNANVLTSVTKGTLVTNAALPPGSWTLHDRAVDTSSNYSSNSALFNLTVTNQNNVITTVTNAPSWLGINPTYAAYPKYIGHMPNSISVTNDVDGTYFDNLGLLNTNTINTVRFDHVPASKAALGFKVEAAETNLLLRSETFDNVKWVKTGSMVVTADQAVAPNGTTTADKLDDTSAGQDQVYNNVTISDDNSVLKYSVFMHKGTSSNVSMNLSLTGGSGSDNVAIFDLENGVALPTTGGAAPDDAGIVAIGNGWFRCWVEKANNGSGNTTARCYIHPAHSATFEEARDNSYTGDCYAWGATLESNLDISSYVKTEGSTVLRDADDIIDNEVSAWWKDDGVGNTIVVDTHLPFVGSLQTVFQIDTASTNNLLSVYFDDGIPTLTIVDSGTIQVSACAVGSAWVDGQSGSFALRVKRNNITFYQDGVSIVSSTTGTIPVFSGGTLRYGNDLSGNYLNGHIAMFEQWAHPQKELDLKFRSRGERVNGRSVGALVRHDLSQSLLPNGTGVGADVTSTYSVDPLPSAVSSTLEYFTPEQTFSFDATNVRVWGDLEGKLMPGASGSAVVDLEIDYRTDAGSYDGFEAWTVGNVTARNILAKPILDTTQGKSRLTKSTLTLDVLDREESAKDIVVSSGGSTILFSEQFHYAPIIQLTVDATSGLFPVKSTVTTSGFTAQVFNTSNQDVGGIIDWQATGA